MFTYSVPFFSLLLVLLNTITTTAQPYKATDHFLLDCGSTSMASTSSSNQLWGGDESYKYVPSNLTTTSFSSNANSQDPSVPTIPYYTARIFNTSSSFTYTFPVSQGPKFLRLHFYPANYSDFIADQSFFSVSSNGYSLLTNFSAFLTARSQLVVKEFLIHVNDSQKLNVIFTPSPDSYAFINGIEIVSMPENLYFNAEAPKYFDQFTGPIIDNQTALENVYRLNMGGGQLTDDTGMYRYWDQDNKHIYGGSFGLTHVNKTPITMEDPNYPAPELVYATQRSMGPLAEAENYYNLTWILSVDSGFYYMLRLHFCSIIPQYTKRGQTVFKIFINKQTAEEEADLFYWTEGSGYAVFRDYAVLVNDPDGQKSKQDLWLELHPNSKSEEYRDGFLNGLEVFKMSSDRNLAGPNPELSSTTHS
ncbi:receptor-like protein kinase FERONIA [Tanacetum coccineum]